MKRNTNGFAKEYTFSPEPTFASDMQPVFADGPVLLFTGEESSIGADVAYIIRTIQPALLPVGAKGYSDINTNAINVAKNALKGFDADITAAKLDARQLAWINYEKELAVEKAGYNDTYLVGQVINKIASLLKNKDFPSGYPPVKLGTQAPAPQLFQKVDWTNEQIAAVETARAEAEAYALAHPYVRPDADYFIRRLERMNALAIEDIKRIDQPTEFKNDDQIRLGLRGTMVLSNIPSDAIPDLIDRYNYAVTKETNIEKILKFAHFLGAGHCPNAIAGLHERVIMLDPELGLETIRSYWKADKEADQARYDAFCAEYNARRIARAAAIEEANRGWSPVRVIAAVSTLGASELTYYAGREIMTGVSEVGDALASIPVIGKPLHAVCDLAIGPIRLQNAIVTGANVKQAVLSDFRQTVADVKDVAAIARIVISYIPAIGPGVACAIGVGLALAEGKTLDEAAIEGVAGAVPPQPFAKAAIMALVGVVNGKGMEDIAVDALARCASIPPTAVAALRVGLKVTARMVEGDNLLVASYEETLAQLPPSVRTIVLAGVAVGTGQKVQLAVYDAIVANPQVIETIGNEGYKYVSKVPVFQDIAGTAAGLKWTSAPPLVKQGFYKGIGLMRSRGVTDKVLGYVRSKLTPEEQKGFDAACMTYAGAVIAPAPPTASTSKSTGGAILVAAAIKAPPVLKLEITELVKSEAEMKAGAVLAAKIYRDKLTDEIIKQSIPANTSPSLAELQMAVTKAAIADAVKEAESPKDIVVAVKAVQKVIPQPVKLSFWAKVKAFLTSKSKPKGKK